MVKATFVLYFLFLLNLNAEAQKLTDTISIHEVKVFGKQPIEEAGILTTHIDTLVLQVLQTHTLSELLSSYSPVFIKSYGRGSSATVSFRGTAPSHTQVYWNGMKVNSLMRGDVDFSLFPIYFIDDMSLQHGGSSLQSGSGALGGSVLINNKADWTDRFSIRYVQTVESFNTNKEYLNVGYGNGKIQFKTRIFSDRSKNDFPYFNYGVLPMHEAIQQNAQYSKSGLLQEIYTRFRNQTLSAKLWAYQSDRYLPQLMSFEGNARKETQNDQNIRAVISWKVVKEKSKMEWFSGVNMSRLNYFRSSTESNFVNYDSRSEEKSFTNTFIYNWTPKETLSFGWSFNTSYSTVYAFDRAKKEGYDHDRLEFSLLNSAHVKVLPVWVVSFLVRSEWYDGHIIGFIPSFGTEYWLDKEQLSSFKLNLSHNYHQPSLNDLYWIPGGNPDLKPEDGVSGDAAFAYKGKEGRAKFSGQITGFASLIDNWIEWRPSVSGATYWEPVNLRKVFARGVEIQASEQIKTANAMQFKLRGNYSYTATSNIDAAHSVDESRGKQLMYIPKHKANLFVETDFKSYYLKMNVPYTGKRYITSNNEESDYEKVLNPYWMVNLTLGKKFDWKHLLADVSLNVENLTNQDYMAILYRPMPGRYYSLTVQIQFRK